MDNISARVEYTEEDRGYTTLCWVWLGSLTETGYGVKWLWPGTDPEGRKSAKAHRYYYEKAYGAVPKGLVLHHLCQTRSCCRPSHLEVMNRGEHISNHKTRLTASQKEEIARLYKSTTLTGRQIAGYFGITQPYVSDVAKSLGVCRGRSFGNIPSHAKARGERIKSSKLTEIQVLTIREEASNGVSQSILATRFGVNRLTISDILRGKTWRHI